MSISLITLASGSSGNVNVVTHQHTVILSDAGISGKRTFEALSQLGLGAPDALLITHSHIDHIKSAHLVAKKFDIPVYMTEGTAREISSIPAPYIHIIRPGETFAVGSLSATAFSVSHDTLSPVGYSFSSADDKACVMTDTGFVSEEMLHSLSGSSSVIVESNHDTAMLLSGPYPPFLKARVKGKKGHLSNEDCASLCEKLLQSGTRRFLLAHLSAENNTPRLAYDTTESRLSGCPYPYTLKVAGRDTPTIL